MFSTIQIIYENTPSNEPDELSIIVASGSWRVLPYLDTVFKPIKDGINGMVKNVKESFHKNYDEVNKNGLSNNNINSLLNAFQGSFFVAIGVIMSVLLAIGYIIMPFTALVSGLLLSVIGFLIGMFINSLLQGCEDERETETPSDTSDSGIINFVINKITSKNKYTKSKGGQYLSAKEWLLALLPSFCAAIAIGYGSNPIVQILAVTWAMSVFFITLICKASKEPLWDGGSIPGIEINKTKQQEKTNTFYKLIQGMALFSALFAIIRIIMSGYDKNLVGAVIAVIAVITSIVAYKEATDYLDSHKI